MLVTYAIVGEKLAKQAEEASIFVYSDPTPEERRQLVETRGIDPHNLDSSLDPDELGRIEFSDGLASIIMKRPRNFTSEDQLLFTVTSMGVFITSERLVVVTTDEVDFNEDKTIHNVRDIRDVVLKLLNGTIAHFLGHLKVINMLSEALEKRINASMENRYLLDMFTLEKSLVYFVNGIGSNRVVFEKMRSSAARFKFDQAQLEIIDDIVIENDQCCKQAEIYTDILTGLMDARGSVVNNNLNVLMKRLTVISVIFMPMNVLAGMGGMSEFSSWTQSVPWWITYPLFLLALVPVGFLTYWILQKTGMDRRRRDNF